MTAPSIPTSLVVGARYRVDNRDDELRRTFRTDGTYLGVEDLTTQDGLRPVETHNSLRFRGAASFRLDLAVQ